MLYILQFETGIYGYIVDDVYRFILAMDVSISV